MNESFILNSVIPYFVLAFIIQALYKAFHKNSYKELHEFLTQEERPSSLVRLPSFQYGKRLKINNMVFAGEQDKAIYLAFPFNRIYKIPYSKMASMKLEDEILNIKLIQIKLKKNPEISIKLFVPKKHLGAFPSITNYQLHKASRANVPAYTPTDIAELNRSTIRKIIMVTTLFISTLVLITVLAEQLRTV